MYTLELMVDIDAVKRRFESLLPTVDERMRRLIAAAESLAIDYGGISIVSRATGVSRRAIARGIVELGNPPMPAGGAIRKPGGGRKSTVEQDATLVRDLERLIEPLSRGDPESPLRWTCKSVRKLAQELGRRCQHGPEAAGTIAGFHHATDLVFHPFFELHSAFAIVADGFNRTSFHGFLAKRLLLRGGRLLKHIGVAAVVAAREISGCGFPAQVAVNALVIDVKFSRHVFRVFIRN